MGSFSNNAITDVGKMLLADVQAGAVFVPTRIVMGSGTMPNGTTIQRMTNVITPVKSLAINKKARTPDGKCVFGGVYTNEEITAPFYFRELALYAKAVYLNEDGSVKSEGAETLYSYGNAGATADYMPAYSTSTVVEKQMDLVIWVGEDTQVDLTIASGVYVTREDVAPSGFGLGTYCAVVDSWNDALQSGWFASKTDGPIAGWWFFGYVANLNNAVRVQYVWQSAGNIAHSGCAAQRVWYGGAFGEWEWINPAFNADEEYRTAERRRGRVVYKKLESSGALKYRLEGDSIWLPYVKEIGAAPDGYGLGTSSQLVDDLNTAITNGWYYFGDLASNRPEHVLYGCLLVVSREGLVRQIMQIAYCVRGTSAQKGVVARRISNDNGGTWEEWEYENPPLATGVEYRTTDRLQGAVMYKKTDGNGKVLWRKENETFWRLLYSDTIVEQASVE